MHAVFVGDQKEKGQEYLSSTPLKIVIGVSDVLDKVLFPSGSSLKRFAGVAFVNIEE